MGTANFEGNVGRDVDYREIEGIGGRATFRIAMNQRIKRNGEWVDGSTTWIEVTCWRLLADHVRDSVRKGDAVVVHGRVEAHRWTDEHGGVHDELRVDALWVGHDLRRGRSQFVRTGRPAPALAPPFETVADAELAALEAREEAAFAAEADAA